MVHRELAGIVNASADQRAVVADDAVFENQLAFVFDRPALFRIIPAAGKLDVLERQVRAGKNMEKASHAIGVDNRASRMLGIAQFAAEPDDGQTPSGD